MRTTVNIHDGLLETVKQRARREGKTLGDVIEDALERYLLAVEAEREAVGPPLPVLHVGGFLPGIDPTSNASILEAIGGKVEDFARQTKDATS